MNLNKLTPAGLCLIRFVTNCKKLTTLKQLPQLLVIRFQEERSDAYLPELNFYWLRNDERDFNKNSLKKWFPVYMYSALAFMWPAKKKDPKDEQTEKSNLILEKADVLFENGRYDECYDLLSNSKDINEVERQWRICRVLYNMAKEPRYDAEKKELILKAYNIISCEVELHNDNFAVHKWYALLLDAKSSNDGIKERIKQLENVRKHMDLAVALNPNDATTLHMLGEWCYQVTEMPWYQRKIAETLFAKIPISNYEDALEYFLRAETAQPRFYSLNLLRLGNCYLKLNKEDQAIYYLELAASYPAKSDDDHRANKEAAQILKKLK